ncbi:class I SAM-dependent methyltransferase [Profundibacter sp.]|uniref:class I SAM-dependent methyltransferase n=1 Tax=Profundibacter sp. TaxID=3101071 RepID=UPI003D0B2029
MSSDTTTIAAYSKAAQDYANGFARKKNAEQDLDMTGFLALVPDGGRILDLGCGPGHWAATFKDAGFMVDATDATPEMADLALERYGIKVRVEHFDALEAVAEYDGVWANFSLLHASRTEFPAHLTRIHRALRPGGALSLGMKLGTGEGRDRLGRFYTYYTQNELTGLVTAAGFTVIQTRRGNGAGLAGGVETFMVLTAHA